jgi:hypothetical protein
VLCLLALLVGAQARAAQTVAVVELVTPPNMMGLGAQVSQRAVAAAKAQKAKVIPPEELLARLGPQRYQALQQCADNPACARSNLAGVSAERVVLGSLMRDERSYLLKLWLIDLARGEVVAQVDRAILIASRRFTQHLDEAVPRLLRAEKEAVGRLKISSSVQGAEVTVDGNPVGPAPIELTLKPGAYEVRVDKPRHLPVRRLVRVEANQTTAEELRLLLAPGELPPDETDLVASAGPGRARGGGLRTAVFILAATTAAAGGTGLGFGLSAQGLERELQDTYQAERQVYGGTRQQALLGKQRAQVANVLYGVAGAAAVGAAVVTLWPSAQPAEMSLLPALTLDGAQVRLEGRF